MKRFVLPVVGFAALVGAAAAFATSTSVSKWWFLRPGSGLPHPVQQPVVATHGSWSGHRWKLVAYASDAKKPLYGGSFYGPSLCWGVTFAGAPAREHSYFIGGGPVDQRGDSGMRCGSTIGIQTNKPHLPAPRPPIDTELLVNQSANGYPSWFAGTVPATTTHVVIRWSALKAEPGSLARPSEVIRTPAFRAPVVSYRVRLAAVPLPRAFSRHTHTKSISALPSSITAVDKRGRIVACYPVSGGICKP